MTIILPCANRKKPNAPTFCLNGVTVDFVANPNTPNQRRPWDRIVPESERTWIHCVADYNNLGHLSPNDTQAGVSISNNRELFCAGTLYVNQAYSDIIASIGFRNLFILSAGWGLVRADHRLPTYNITFSTAKKTPAHARIKQDERKQQPKLQPDGIHLDEARLEVFVGKEYKRFLEDWIPHEKYHSHPPTGRRTWYYQAAIDFIQEADKTDQLHPLACPNSCDFLKPELCCGPLPPQGTRLVVV